MNVFIAALPFFIGALAWFFALRRSPLPFDYYADGALAGCPLRRLPKGPLRECGRLNAGLQTEKFNIAWRKVLNHFLCKGLQPDKIFKDSLPDRPKRGVLAGIDKLGERPFATLPYGEWRD